MLTLERKDDLTFTLVSDDRHGENAGLQEAIMENMTQCLQDFDNTPLDDDGTLRFDVTREHWDDLLNVLEYLGLEAEVPVPNVEEMYDAVREAASSVHGWSAEAKFAGPEDTTLIRKLYASGALFVANYVGLHPFGLAFGVDVDTQPEDTQPEDATEAADVEQRITEMFMGQAGPDLSLYETTDPEGVEYGDDLKELGLAKLTDDMLARLHGRLTGLLDDIERTRRERIIRSRTDAGQNPDDTEQASPE